MSLVFARRSGQKILIGSNVTVTVCEILSGSQVRLAIDAPKEVPVHRAEVAARMAKEKRNRNE